MTQKRPFVDRLSLAHMQVVVIWLSARYVFSMQEGQHFAGTAVAVAVDADGPLAGVLLMGPPESGKSSTARALIEGCPWRRTRLVADDAIIVENDHGVVLMSAPSTIKGLIEIRGFGPAPVRQIASASLLAAFDLGVQARRLPDPAQIEVAGAGVPLWPLTYLEGVEHSIRIILRAILAGQTP